MTSLAFRFARASAGSNSAARMPTMAITTSNSINVNARSEPRCEGGAMVVTRMCAFSSKRATQIVAVDIGGEETQPFRVSEKEGGLSTARWARLIMRLPLLLTRRLWIWPLVAALLLGLVGYWVRSRLESTMKEELTSRLETLLRADVAELRL